MDDRRQIVAGALIGAAFGALVSYSAFTGSGRGLLARLNPALDDLSEAVQEFRVAIRKAEGVAHDAKGAVDDVRSMFAGERLES